MTNTSSEVNRKQILAIASYLWDVRPPAKAKKVREQWLRDVVAVANGLGLSGELKEAFYKEASAVEFYLSKEELASL
jgi:hypothetical protein